MQYDEITTFNTIPRKYKFAEVKKEEKGNLTSTSTVNFHRTGHRIDVSSKPSVSKTSESI